MRNFSFIPSFDGLRAIAVLLVILEHSTYGYIHGWIGVDIFFVLSGYLITSLLQKEYHRFNQVSFYNFYVRRLLRLAPALVVAVIFANIFWHVTTAGWSKADRILATLSSLFYFNNLLPTAITGSLNPLWSLSVEEHFYFIWPVVATFFLFQLPRKLAIISVVFLIAIVSVFRVYAYHHEHDLVWGIFVINYYKFTFCRIDSIMLGSLLSLIPSVKKISFLENNSAQLLSVLSLLYLPVLIYVHAMGSWLNTGGFLITNLLCMLTVVVAMNNPNQVVLAHPVLRWIGRRSYGIYLYHQTIVVLFEGFREVNNPSNLILVTFFRIGASILVAAISFWLIEEPILRYKHKFELTDKAKKHKVVV